MAYTKIKHIIEQTVASGLIYLNSHARDFQNPEMRPYLDRYLRGSNGYKAEERVKLMKLLWDSLATEFGGRHELYEINYGGSTEEIRRYCLFGRRLPATRKNSKDSLRSAWPNTTSTAGVFPTSPIPASSAIISPIMTSEAGPSSAPADDTSILACFARQWAASPPGLR